MSSQTLAQWVSAIGSAGSLLGFAAYVWIMLLNRKDQQSVRQEQQAQGVTAWLDEGARHDRDEDYVLVVHNGGDSPVFQVRCLFSLPSSDDQHAVQLSLLPPRHDAVRSLPFDADHESSGRDDGDWEAAHRERAGASNQADEAETSHASQTSQTSDRQGWSTSAAS